MTNTTTAVRTAGMTPRGAGYALGLANALGDNPNTEADLRHGRLPHARADFVEGYWMGREAR